MRLRQTTTRNQLTDLLADKVDAGTTNPTGHLYIYDDSSETTLLADMDLNNTAYHASGAEGGAGAATQPATVGKAWMDVTTTQPQDATPAANGVAGYAKITDRDDGAVVDGACGAVGSGAFVELVSTTISTAIPCKLGNGALFNNEGSL